MARRASGQPSGAISENCKAITSRFIYCLKIGTGFVAVILSLVGVQPSYRNQKKLRAKKALDAFLPNILHFVPIPSHSLKSASEKQLFVLRTALCSNQTFLLREISLYGQVDSHSSAASVQLRVPDEEVYLPWGCQILMRSPPPPPAAPPPTPPPTPPLKPPTLSHPHPTLYGQPTGL